PPPSPETPKSAAAPQPPPAPAPPAAPLEPAFWTAAVGAGGLATWGPSPSAMPGVLLYAGAAWRRHSLLSPSLRVSASHGGRDSMIAGGGTVGFTLDLLGLDICPVSVAPFRLNLRACASGTLGELSAHSSGIRGPLTAHQPFGTLGGTALISYELGLRVEISAMVGASAPLSRDSFQFNRQSSDFFTFFKVQPVTVTAGLGLGFRIL
ncbi:MAG TPA: hypothetical protein VGL13_00175, partial [Polyangiaceae bacterium]